MVFITGMTIWILALVLMASLAGLGYRQGAVRVGFSLVGIIFSALLAGPLAKLVRPLLPHLGVHNPVQVWLIAPFLVFLIVLTLFKSAGFFVHRKLDVHYKYHEGDLGQLLWVRLNRRLGLCLGLINGLFYLILISFVIYDFSYWTTQITQAAPSDGEAMSVRLLNRMGHNLNDTGMDKVARAIDPMPETYFQSADLAGLLYQKPQLDGRLSDYPAFISLGQRDDFQLLAHDADFQNAWQTHAPAGQLLNYPTAKAIWQNNDTANLIWGIVQTNLDDLNGYLKTGQSAKYGSEKIIGRWDVNVGASVGMLLQTRPNIPSNEMKTIRTFWTQAYAQTIFIAGADGQAFLKNLPAFKSGAASATETATWTGQWSSDDTNYDLTLTSNGENKSMTAQTDGIRLTLKDSQNILVFDRE
jgi:uncharacterized membrane protein required for colicin V production